MNSKQIQWSGEQLDLKKYRVEQLPSVAYYIPDFISEEEESFLIQHILNSPKTKWNYLGARRLQMWGGRPHPKGMIQEDLPQWIDPYCDRICKTGVFEGKSPNHILINEYLPGQGIMPHEDGPLYNPTITTINVGSHTLLNFFKPVDHQLTDENAFETRCIGSLLLERRSLLILQEDLYNEYLHGINCVTSDVLSDEILNLSMCSIPKIPGNNLHRSTRYSLTIRHVPKVSKVKLRLGR
ncbi:Alpha-ketoglutarate-dependent dioxygenase alkB 6 [Nymphon striatum]|nr:Alpha-ketoglutarate-dependent dioxygenase alkB 6 [Nymphon striatum]